MSINSVQVPNFAATVQNAFNSNEMRRSNRVQEQRQAGQDELQKYTMLKQHIEQGIKRVQELRANTPADQMPDMKTFASQLLNAGDIADKLGNSLGVSAGNTIRSAIEQAMLSPDATTVARNKGTLAAETANAEAVTAQSLGTPGVVGTNSGVQAGNQAVAQANTEVAGGLPQTQAKADVAKREALGDMLVKLSGAEGEEADAIKRDALGLKDEKEYSATVLNIALARAGALEQVAAGEPLTDEQMSIIEEEMGKLRATDKLANVFEALGIGASFPGTSSQPATKSKKDEKVQHTPKSKKDEKVQHTPKSRKDRIIELQTKKAKKAGG